MKRFALALSLALIVGSAIGWVMAGEAANPPNPAQVNPDVYACCGLPSVFAGWTPGDLSTLNPITVKLRAGIRSISYSYIVVPGCSDGNLYDNLQVVLRRTTELTGVAFPKVSSGADVSIRSTCGVDAANVGVTGGVIGDLYPRWPYESTVNINTIMATYPDITQQSIWCHEFCGHALGTWDEGYKKDGSFGSVPGFIDFMNTGPDSRYLWPQNDVDRWERTLFTLPVAVTCTPVYAGWDDCVNRYRFLDGFSYEPSTGRWWNPDQTPEWEPCNQDSIRWNLVFGFFAPPGSGEFVPHRG
jgi:hypothetical protein